MKAKIVYIALALVLVLSFSLVTAAPAMAKAPLVVDDDGVQCPKAAYTTIQAAVDAASPGDTIRVCAGVYYESVVISTNDITLKAEPGAILDGTDAGVDGITLTSGVSGVTIKYFEIRNYTGTENGQGNAIQAWNDGTSDITVKENWMHDNSWNAILVGNEGTGLHTGWVVKGNTIEDNGLYSLELTNCSDCEAKGNIVSGGYAGILIQARNTIPGSGVFDTANVQVKGNEVSGANIGIYVIAQVSEPTPPFNPISGASTELRTVVLADNEVHDNTWYGIYVYGYYGVAAGIDVKQNDVHDNGDYDGIVLNNVEWSSVLQNTVSDSGRYGISLRGGASDNEVKQNAVSGSGSWDLHDSTAPPPLDNTWKENTGTPNF